MKRQPRITLNGVCTRLKRLIADIKNINYIEIRVSQSLTSDLGFTRTGVRALARHINRHFSDVCVSMVPDEVGKAKTVIDLAVAIWGKVPPNRKTKR